MKNDLFHKQMSAWPETEIFISAEDEAGFKKSCDDLEAFAQNVLGNLDCFLCDAVQKAKKP